jgi:hypothetical protein
MLTLQRLAGVLTRLYGLVLFRVYGTVFIALGALFVYWGGRGLLAYTSGVRAAWTEPGVCVLGLIAGPLIAWFGWRMLRDAPSRSKPLFPQSALLVLTLMAVGGASVVFALMGTDGIPFAFMAFAVGTAGLVRWWSRRGGRGEARDAEAGFLETVTELEDEDPAEAQRLMEQHFEAEARKHNARKAELWDRAPTDRGAAKQLRNILGEDLAATRHALEEWERSGDLTPRARADLTTLLDQTEAEIRRVDRYLGRLD